MKKLLLISYYFPPCGGAAVQRWLRFIQQLTAKDWQITVVCPVDGDYPFYDNSLLSKLPAGINVIQTKSFSINKVWNLFMGDQQTIPYGSLESNADTSKLKKLLIWIRVNLIIPDMRVFWNRFAYLAAFQEMKQNHYDVLVTSGPPHSTHLIGLKLKARFKLRWVADFRDPWSTIHYLQMQKPYKLSLLIHRYLEKRVLSTADLSLIVSQPIADSFPKANKLVVLNGYDADEYSNLTYQQSSVFRIKYVGQLTAGQDIGSLLESISSFVKENPVEFKFIGTKLTATEKEKFRAVLSEFTCEPFVYHVDALSEMVNAELLIIVINNTKHNLGIITTKLFEYIGSQTPILCIGPMASEAAKLILDYKAGICFDNSSDAGIPIYLHDLYQQWTDSQPLRNTFDVSPLSVQKQIDILDAALQKPKCGRK